MAFKIQSSVKCFFCGGALRLQYLKAFHPFKTDHGPFDIYQCTHCRSCQTFPLPSEDSLERLYRSYHEGLPAFHRTITIDDPQTALYKKCITRMGRLTHRLADDQFTWLEVGSGGGEFSALLLKQFPKSRGVAIDLHPRPASLANLDAIDWKQININQEIFSTGLPQFDLIVSFAVLEHVLRPDWLINNLLRLLNPGGTVYLLCPNNASLASRLLRRRWPYFTPGEHLAVPTPSGAINCLQREWHSLQRNNADVKIYAKPLMLPYTLRYVMRRLGADVIGRMIPPGWGLSLPVGALEMALHWQKDLRSRTS